MGAKGSPKQLALDTNLVLDLAEGADFAHDFKEQLQRRRYALLLPPMVVAELHENYEHGSTVPLLVTSDRHLLDVDADALALALHDADLAPVHPVHPKAVLKAVLKALR